MGWPAGRVPDTENRGQHDTRIYVVLYRSVLVGRWSRAGKRRARGLRDVNVRNARLWGRRDGRVVVLAARAARRIDEFR